MAEQYYILGSKLSVGAYDQGYLSVDEPDVCLDVWGKCRFRKAIDLTDSSLVFGGPSCSVGGNGSTVFGSFNVAQGYNSISQGQYNVSGSNNSITVGTGLGVYNDNEAGFGTYNVANATSSEANVIFVVGNGRDAANCSDAFRVYNYGTVFANALTTNNGIELLDPLYTGALIESSKGQKRGIGIDANTTYVYGPSVQLAASNTYANNALQPHVTISANGTVIDSDCVFHGNVTVIGQTFSTFTNVYTTVASTIECSDPIIGVAHQFASGGNTYDIGLMGERPNSNVGVIWDESNTEWAFINTQQGTTSTQLTNFTYADLRVQDLTVANVNTSGHLTQQGDLGVIGSAVMNNLTVSNTFITSSGQFPRSIMVNGPSILNTLFVANQATFNQGLYPSEPDSWPVGQVDNRFSRAFFDSLDVYDQLQLPGPVQDTYAAKIGSVSQANVYLYTTSPFYQDTVGIYFDKGQSQLPYAKSSLVQTYDHFALNTLGQNRLVANTVTGNIVISNELVVVGNVQAYGPQSRFVNNVLVQGGFSANTATWTNTTTYGGNLVPTIPDAISVGVQGQRFANVYVDTLDAYQPGLNIASTLNIGSGAVTNAYVYSNASGPVLITFDNKQSASGKSTLLQDASTFRLLGMNVPIMIANTVSSNVTMMSDLLTLGNQTCVGQVATVQNILDVTGSLLSNTAYFANNLVMGANILPSLANTFTLGNAADRFSVGFLNSVDLYDTANKPLRVGSAAATNVYVYTDITDTTSSVSLTLDKAGNAQPTAKSFLMQDSVAGSWGVNGQKCLVINNSTGNLSVTNDTSLAGNLGVLGTQSTLNNLNVAGNLIGNSAYWTNASVFQGPLLAYANNAVTVGNTANRFGNTYLQRADLYDTVNPLRAGAPGVNNVYLYSDCTNASNGINLTMDQNGVSRTSLVQNLASFALATQGVPRMVANIATGNVTFINDVLVGGNLQLLGQNSTINQDLRLLGHFAANSVFIANGTVVDGNLNTLTPNTWTIGAAGNRFQTAYLNNANVYNQSGAAQRFGSNQDANVGIFTDSQLVGQTATLFLDKGGSSRTSLTQDGSSFYVRQNGKTLLFTNNNTGNLSITQGDVSMLNNLSVYGQSVIVQSDTSVQGRTVLNTLYVNNTTVLCGNVTPSGTVCLGNPASRFGSLFIANADIYSNAPQVLIGGPQNLNVVLQATGNSPAALSFTHGSNSAGVIGLANGLALTTMGLTRVQIGLDGNVITVTDSVGMGNTAILGPVMTAAGNLGLRGQQSRYPLDFNNFTGEKTIGLANCGWIGSNGVSLSMAYQASNAHKFTVAANSGVVGTPVLSLLPNLTTVAYGDVLPAADVTSNLGIASSRWLQVYAGNAMTSSDSTFNGVVVGTLGGATGSLGLASNSQPSNGFAIVQHPSGNTFVNSTNTQFVKLATGNVVGASFSSGQLRIGDTQPASRTLEVVRDAAIGGVIYASQTSGYPSNPTVLNPSSGGWLQLGNLTVGNASHAKVSLLGQSNLSNTTTYGGETIIYVASCANNSTVTGSWSAIGYQPLVSNVRLVKQSANTYSLLALNNNTAAYAATTSLTNASFSYSGIVTTDPGVGNSVVVLPQQLVLSGFTIFGNSTGVLSNAIGGQPFLFNGNSIIYSAYSSVGICTTTPRANLDVNGSFCFTGPLLCNGVPLPLVTASNAFVSIAADPGLYAANVGLNYPSSLRIGDYNPPTGVLEAVQGNAAIKIGGLNGRAGDLSTNANLMSFNIANSAASWTFNKLASYGNVGSKQTVATIDPTGSYIQSSDLRYKNSITDVTDDMLTRMLSLRPRMYKVNGSDRDKYGLIAQEAQEAMPEIVHVNEAGFMAVDYTSLVPLLLKALQKLTVGTT